MPLGLPTIAACVFSLTAAAELDAGGGRRVKTGRSWTVQQVFLPGQMFPLVPGQPSLFRLKQPYHEALSSPNKLLCL